MVVAKGVEEQVDVGTEELPLRFIGRIDRGQALVGEIAAVSNAIELRPRVIIYCGRTLSIRHDVEPVAHAAIGCRNSEPVRHRAGILTDIINAAIVVGVGRARAIGDVVAEFVLGEAPVGPIGGMTGIEDRQFQMLAVDRIGVDLHAPEGVVILVAVGGAGGDVMIDLLIFAHLQQTVDEQAIADDWPAGFDRGRQHAFAVGAAIGVLHASVVAAIVEVLAAAPQAVGLPIDVQRGHEVVGAGFRHGIDDAAGRPAIFRRIAAGLKFDALVEVERHARRPQIIVEVRRVEAVHIIGVLRDRRTADRDIVAELAVATGGARRQQNDAAQRAADSVVLDQVLHVDIDAGGRSAQRLVEARAGDDDRFACRQRDVEVRRRG